MQLWHAVAIPAVFLGLACAACVRSPEAKSAAHLAAGQKFLQKQQSSRAILEFKSAIQAAPRNAEAYYRLATAYLAEGDVSEGVAALRQATEINPQHKGAQLRLAQLMTMVDNRTTLMDAQSRLQALVSDAPDNATAMHALAIADLKLGDTEEAAKLLDRALEAAPREIVIAATTAELKLQQKDAKGAEEVLRKACASAPDSADGAVVLGRFLASQNRPAEAEQQFQRAISIDGNHGPALLNLAVLQNQLGRKQEAEANFKRLSRLPGKTFKSVYATVLFQEGKRDQAIQEFERLAKEDPEDRAVRTRLVAAYLAANREPDADRVLAAALKRNPRDLDALLQRGQISLSNGQFQAAQLDLNEVLHFTPDSVGAHLSLAHLYLAQGSDSRYRQELSDALHTNPEALAVRLELAQALMSLNRSGAAAALDLLNSAPSDQKELTPMIVKRNWALWSLNNRGEMRKGIDQGLAKGRTTDLLLQDALWKLQARDFAGARAVLEEALKIDLSDLRALAVLNQTYSAQSQNKLGLSKIKEYVALQPGSAPAQDFLGLVLLSNGDRAGARTAFLAAKAADPHYRDADFALIQMDALEGNWDDARQSLQHVLVENPGNPLARLWLGDVDAMKGDSPGALEEFRKVVRNSPENAQALNNLAYILVAYSKQPDEALPYAQKAVELAPENPDYADTLGWVLYQKGLYGRAIQNLERAASKTQNAAWKYHLAMAYAKAGQPARAHATLEAALSANPNAPEAQPAIRLVGSAK